MNGDETIQSTLHRQGSSLLCLPDELIVRCFSYLDYRKIAYLERTCKRIERITRSFPELWRTPICDGQDRFSHLPYHFERVQKRLGRAHGKLHDFEVSIVKATVWNTDALQKAVKMLQTVPVEQCQHLSISIWSNMSEDDENALAQAICDFLGRCRHLRELDLRGDGVYTLLGLTRIWPTTLPPLQILRLADVPCISLFLDWLEFFATSLQKVQIGTKPVVDIKDLTSHPTTTLLKVEHFNLTCPALNVDELPYLPSIHLPALKYLTIEDPSQDVAFFHWLCAPTIEDLSIFFGGPGGDRTEERLCSLLPSLINLQKLDFFYLKEFWWRRPYRIVDTLAESTCIPLTHLKLDTSNTTAQYSTFQAAIVRLVESRRTSANPITSLIVVHDGKEPDPAHLRWLEASVNTVVIVNRDTAGS